MYIDMGNVYIYVSTGYTSIDRVQTECVLSIHYRLCNLCIETAHMLSILCHIDIFSIYSVYACIHIMSPCRYRPNTFCLNSFNRHVCRIFCLYIDINSDHMQSVCIYICTEHTGKISIGRVSTKCVLSVYSRSYKLQRQTEHILSVLLPRDIFSI